MNWNIAQLSHKQQQAVLLVCRHLNQTVQDDGIPIIPIASNGISSVFTKDSLKIYTNTINDFLYCFAKACIEKKSVLVSTPLIKRGIMLDASRNGTIRIEKLKQTALHCACLGINRMYLYMEDVYTMEKYPYFGAYRGRYTQSELKELDAFAASLGVEVIPTIQTLAHLHTYFRWKNTKPLQDTNDILRIDLCEAFVEEMVKTMHETFCTEYIHLGMDEADALGLGTYLRANGYHPTQELMRSHLALLEKICRKYGMKPIVWGDMFLRPYAKNGQYYNVEKDVVIKENYDPLQIVYWDYYHQSIEEYLKNISLHKQVSCNVSFACGGWTWNGIAPHYQKALQTMRQGIVAARLAGLKEAFCTFWFDNGMETPLETAIYPMIHFSSLTLDTLDIDAWCFALTGHRQREYEMLGMFDGENDTQSTNIANPSKYLFYQDPLVGKFDGQIQNIPYEEKYTHLYEQLTDTNIFAYYKKLALFLSYKAQFGIHLRKAYKDNTLQTLLPQCETMISLLEEIRLMRQAIWFEECKPFGYEVLDIRFGALKQRITSTVMRIQDYIQHNIDRIEELEEPYVVADCDENPCFGGFWEDIVSCANVSGI